MNQRILPLQIAGFIFTIFFSLSFVGCENPSVSRPMIEPNELELKHVGITPWVTKPGEPFTLEVIVRGKVGPRIYFYPELGARFGPDGIIIPNTPSRLLQNGLEREYLELQKDENYSENQVYLESRFTANDVVFNLEDKGIAVSTIRDIRIQDPENLQHFNLFKILVPFRTADPTLIGEPEVIQLDTDVRATSRVVNIISDEADDVSEYQMREVSQRFYNFFSDDRDFLVVHKPPNVDPSAGGYFFISGERDTGLGSDVSRNPELFGSAFRLKGVIQSLRGIFSQGVSADGDFCLLTHELLHRWAAFAGEPLSVDGFHWRIDPLLGLDREDSGFGRNKTCKLNDFELYLAGFIPADSVNTQLNKNGYTIDDFITDNGRRNPEYPDTQRDFNLGFIVESTEPLSDHEMAYFHFIAEEVTKQTSLFSQTWYQSTGKRSTLNSKLSFPTNNLP